ncbi:MAG TPA: erythromycin esterase family protein [Longimicrobiaceae bacterium]|nr:erythromycin esterase family protein [Longimicrobiaceae bacterium]
MRPSPLAPLLLLGWLAAALPGCGSDRGPVAPPAPPPVQPADPERLLSDAELATPADPQAPAENAAWEAWVRANHHPVRSVTATRDFSDLQFLKPLLAGRRVVQLGESGHGVREFNQAKVRLIRFLHQEMGFEVIAFESGLYECWQADRSVGSAAPRDVMRSCIFGVWHTEEVLPLFDYLAETRRGGRPLTLAGFDTQMSSRTGSVDRPAFFRDLVARVDTAYARRVHALDSAYVDTYQRGTFASFSAHVAANQTALLAGYDTLTRFFERHGAELGRADPSRPRVGLLARQAAWSAGEFARQTLPGGGMLRDPGMADNITFLLREMYPDKKIIVWAHNAHIRHAGQATTYAPGNRMGTFVAERHRAELYTVGLYMYRGTSASNSRQTMAVTPHEAGSLESVLYRTRRKYAFVDLLGQPRSGGSEWIFQPVTAKEWGQSAYRMVPRDQYDGILFVDSTSVPQYLVQ